MSDLVSPGSPVPPPGGQVPAPAPPPLPPYSAAEAAARAEAIPATQPPAYPPPSPYPGYPVHPAHAHPGPYAAPYSAPPGSPTNVAQPAYGGPLAAPGKGKALGVVALVAGIVALVVPTIAVAIAAYQIGLGAARRIAAAPMSTDFDWSVLSPVRDWVLLGETAFWVGTVLGLWALAQGIVALVTNRGRGAGIGAVVLAGTAPIAFVIAVNVFIAMGIATGAGLGG